MNILFVGGPLDGHREDFLSPSEVYNCIPPTQTQNCLLAPNEISEPLSVIRYRLSILQFALSAIHPPFASLAFYFYAPLSDYDALKLLSDNYQKKKC